MRSILLLLAGFAVVPSHAIAVDPAPSAEGIAFFESKIRPVLLAHCVKCHSAEAATAKKLKGGLLLDTRAAMLEGGDSGPAVVPGKSDAGTLIASLMHTGETKMPPAGKLPDSTIADFKKWLTLGAPDPRVATANARKSTAMTVEEGRKFWAYRPVVPLADPEADPSAAIDRRISAGLAARNLQFAPEAPPDVLIRRLYLDLIGLPPTPDEVDAFRRDRSPKAVETVVDSLLARPEFGERWGRHWLDVARFGESLTLRGFLLKESWRYRDYVIDNFNADVPFDRTIREQIAGDLLPFRTPEERRRNLIATTYLAMGNHNLEEQDKKQLRMDVVDEQLDAISKGFLAQTVTCARCHDHKFDPIPTADYYALAGILSNARSMDHANVSQWLEVPLPVDPAREAEFVAHDRAVAGLRERVRVEKGKLDPKLLASKGAIAVADVPGIVVDDAQARKVGAWVHSTSTGAYIGDGYLHDDNRDKGRRTLTFQTELPATGKYEVRLAWSWGPSRSTAVPVTVVGPDGETVVRVDMTKTPPIAGRYISLGEYRFEKSGQSFVIVSNEGTTGHVTADAVIFIPVDAPKAIRSDAGPTSAKALTALEAELGLLVARGPKRPMTMTVQEEKKIEDARILVRGSVHNPGANAPRGMLRVATVGAMPAVPAGQSGRKELADWIASPENPLTSRAIVNRAWYWVFGSGIVRTLDNFGTTGESPSNPELLDGLAARFVRDGWSIKKLVRAIVLSRTYRQTSADAASLAADPENRLFGRANRRRLDAEVIRDTMLAVGGKLDPTRGGSNYPATLTADYGFRASDNRRSVYAPVFRNALPEAFDLFDFADPSTVSGRRNTSTVAPQALYLMNHPFPREHARAAAQRILDGGFADDSARVTRAYRLVVGRTPSENEMRISLKYIASKATDPVAGWSSLVHMLFASADFRYVD